MSGKFGMTAAILLPAWLFSHCAQADETMARRARPEPPIEVCEAFPWDVPVEHSFTAESVSRWRRTVQSVQQQGKLLPRDRFAERKP